MLIRICIGGGILLGLAGLGVAKSPIFPANGHRTARQAHSALEPPPCRAVLWIRASKGVMRHSAPYLIGRALDAHTPDPNRYRSAQLFSIWICAVSLAEASDS